MNAQIHCPVIKLVAGMAKRGMNRWGISELMNWEKPVQQVNRLK
jgi:hypothetical protein